MRHSYPRAPWALRAGLLLAPLGAAQAQAPVITSVIPMANARAASRNSPVTVSFNQPLTAASAGALKVFSSQRGGLRTRGTTPAVVSGNALSFAPTAYDFRPGETVQYTVTTAAAGSGGALAQGRVGQFTAAVGGSGNGVFVAGTDAAVGSHPTAVTIGDVDGDGDLDLLTANSNFSGTVSIRFNNGTGVFGGGTDIAVGSNPNYITLGDVDGDGDLDLLVVNVNAFGSVSVRLNNGSGAFGGGQDVGNTGVGNLALGDVDGDGDLDFLVVSQGFPGQVRLFRNDGTGMFAGGQSIAIPLPTTVVATAARAVLGDVDNDGDLDLLVTNYNFGGPPSSNTVSVLLNTGYGVFISSTSVVVGNGPENLAVADIDGDGDLDLLTANYVSTVSVRLNDGTGTFSGVDEVAIGIGVNNIRMDDVDNDGDFDLLTSNASSRTVSVRLNSGSGAFSGSQEVSVGAGGPFSVAVGDVDNDGDLDLLTDNGLVNGTVSVRLNGGTGPLAAAPGHPAAPALALFPNPAHGTTTLTGTAPNVPLTVLDALGRVLLTATADATGAARLVLPEGLPAGVYLVHSGGQVRRLVVE